MPLELSNGREILHIKPHSCAFETERSHGAVVMVFLPWKCWGLRMNAHTNKFEDVLGAANEISCPKSSICHRDGKQANLANAFSCALRKEYEGCR